MNESHGPQGNAKGRKEEGRRKDRSMRIANLV